MLLLLSDLLFQHTSLAFQFHFALQRPLPFVLLLDELRLQRENGALLRLQLLRLVRGTLTIGGSGGSVGRRRDILLDRQT